MGGVVCVYSLCVCVAVCVSICALLVCKCVYALAMTYQRWDRPDSKRNNIIRHASINVDIYNFLNKHYML